MSTFHDEQHLESRLNFLYKATEDTQNTIRFIDTKAAFCVTLLSALTAGSLQATHPRHHALHEILFTIFLLNVGVALIICLRVIFPVIKPAAVKSSDPARPLPKFFVYQNKSHHWIRHTFSNSVNDVLCDDHDSYTTTLRGATDADLVTAMCDEVLMVSLIRQIKSDRLHTAMFSLAAGVFLFIAVMLS